MNKTNASQGSITVHVLDTVHGRAGAGIGWVLSRVSGEMRQVLGRGQTNEDGRTDDPLLSGSEIHEGTYEVLFDIGAWSGASSDFYDLIPIRFRVKDTAAHYHVPLLLSAYGYSTYRGT